MGSAKEIRVLISIIHFVCPPNFAGTIVFNVSWEHKIKNSSLCKMFFGGGDNVYYGNMEVANRPSPLTVV